MLSSLHSSNILIASVTAATLAVIGLASMYLPVGRDEESSAMVLSKTGPRGAAAYQSAMSDGVLTASDMRQIRDASGVDLDRLGALDRTAEGRK